MPSKKASVIKSILLIFAVAFVQPYAVLILDNGLSSTCMDCSILEQTYLSSLLYLALPMSAIYIFTKWYRINHFIQAITISLYFVVVSLIILTIPLFEDRIAAWSTFSDQEVWTVAVISALPGVGIIGCVMTYALGRFNR